MSTRTSDLDGNTLADRAYVGDQYQETSKLTARLRLVSREDDLRERDLHDHLEWLIGSQGDFHLTVAAAMFVAR